MALGTGAIEVFGKVGGLKISKLERACGDFRDNAKGRPIAERQRDICGCGQSGADCPIFSLAKSRSAANTFP
jgi:hypothetical protein